MMHPQTLPSRNAFHVKTEMEKLMGHLDQGETLKALQQVSLANQRLADIAAKLCLQGAREGLTQKAMAEALDVPVSVLRGLKREAALRA